MGRLFYILLPGLLAILVSCTDKGERKTETLTADHLSVNFIDNGCWTYEQSEALYGSYIHISNLETYSSMVFMIQNSPDYKLNDEMINSLLELSLLLERQIVPVNKKEGKNDHFSPEGIEIVYDIQDAPHLKGHLILFEMNGKAYSVNRILDAGGDKDMDDLEYMFNSIVVENIKNWVKPIKIGNLRIDYVNNPGWDYNYKEDGHLEELVIFNKAIGASIVLQQVTVTNRVLDDVDMEKIYSSIFSLVDKTQSEKIMRVKNDRFAPGGCKITYESREENKKYESYMFQKDGRVYFVQTVSVTDNDKKIINEILGSIKDYFSEKRVKTHK